MLQGKNAFEILGIEQTNDEKAIKSAYAKLVKQYHPEEDEENWKLLFHAYEDALNYARDNQQKNSMDIILNRGEARLNTHAREAENARGNLRQNVVEEELEIIIDRLGQARESTPDDMKGQEAAALKSVFEWMDAMEENGGGNFANWELFLKSKNYKKICMRAEYLVRLESLLEKVMVDEEIAYLLHKENDRISQTLKKKNAFIDQSEIIRQLDEKVDIEKGKYKRERSRSKRKALMAAFGLVAVLVLLLIIVLLIRFGR